MDDNITLSPTEQTRLNAFLANRAKSQGASVYNTRTNPSMMPSSSMTAQNDITLSPTEQARLDAFLSKRAAKQKADKMSYFESVPRDIAQGLTQGTTELAQNIVPFVSPSAAKFLPAIQQVQGYAPKIGSGKSNLASNLIRSFSSFLPYAAAGETVGADSILGKMAVNASTGGLQGYNESSNNQTNLYGLLPNGKKGATLEEAITNALLPPALKIFEKARPSQFLRGGITNEQLKNNLEATKQTSTGLGDVVQNKYAKGILENLLPSFAFTGADKVMSATKKQLQDSTKSFLNKLLGDNSPVDIPGQIRKSLNDSYNKVKAIKQTKANKLNEAADSAGMSVGRENQRKFAQSALDEINSDSELASSIPPELVKDLESHINDFDNQSLKNADISLRKLDDKASKYYKQGDTYESGIYAGLKKAKQADIDSTLDKATDENVKSLRDDFRNYYKNQYAPYLDPMIKKFLDYGEGDTDVIVESFLKASKATDRGRMLSKLTTNMSSNHRNLVPYYYFSKSLDNDGSVNLNTWLTLSNKLGESQENSLFKDKDLQNAYNKLTRAIALNSGPRNTMANPLNGQMNRILLGLAGTHMAGKVGGNAATTILGPQAYPLGYLVGAATPSLVGQITTKALTSEKLRTRLVEEMLKDRKRFQGPMAQIGSQTFLQGLMNMQGGQ